MRSLPFKLPAARPDRWDADHLPLGAWLAVAVLSGLVAAATLLGLVSERRHFVEFNQARIKNLAQAIDGDADAVSVIVIGDSRMKYATLDGPEMAAVAEHAGIDDFHVLRITNNDAQFKDFADLTDTLLEARPDFLLLQLNLSFAERSWLEDGLWFFRRGIRRLAGGKGFAESQDSVQFSRPCLAEAGNWQWDDETLEQQVAAFRVVPGGNPKTDNYPAFARFVTRAKALGLRVALVQLRSLRPMEDAFYGPGNAYYPWAFDTIGQDLPVPIWQQPEELIARKYYCDFAHLSDDGRSAFTDWLVSMIVAAQNPT